MFKKQSRPEKLSNIFALQDHLTRKINKIIDMNGAPATILSIIENEYTGDMKGVRSIDSVRKYIRQYKNGVKSDVAVSEYSGVVTDALSVDNEVDNIKSVMWTEQNANEL